MIDFNLINKDHIHGLVVKLWSNNDKCSIPLVTYKI
jgi:hypothetical protein